MKDMTTKNLRQKGCTQLIQMNPEHKQTLSLTLIYPDFWQILFVFQINSEFRMFYLFLLLK